MIPGILIADNEEHVRDLLKMIAGTIHFRVYGEASDGEQVISLFKQQIPDILIMDINMPLKAGDEILEELQNELENTCVIIMTAIMDNEDIENCLKLGAKTFIRKDAPIYKMVKTINETWTTFEKERSARNMKKYDLNQLMAEAKEDKILKNLA